MSPVTVDPLIGISHHAQDRHLIIEPNVSPQNGQDQAFSILLSHLPLHRWLHLVSQKKERPLPLEVPIVERPLPQSLWPLTPFLVRPSQTVPP